MDTTLRPLREDGVQLGKVDKLGPTETGLMQGHHIIQQVDYGGRVAVQTVDPKRRITLFHMDEAGLEAPKVGAVMLLRCIIMVFLVTKLTLHKT